MCPSRPHTEMETLYLFQDFFLHLDQHVVVFDLQPLQIEILSPQGMEWALFWVEKHHVSYLTINLNYSLWVKK